MQFVEMINGGVFILWELQLDQLDNAGDVGHMEQRYVAFIKN